MTPKLTLLHIPHLRLKVKKYLVFEYYTDYINTKFQEFEDSITKTKNLHVFYRKMIQLARLDIVTFTDVYSYYMLFMKRNVRYNLFMNADVLIIENQMFCYRINEIFRQKEKEKKKIKHKCDVQPYVHRYKLISFDKYIYVLSNSIEHECRVHNRNIYKYRRDYFCGMQRSITYYWK